MQTVRMRDVADLAGVSIATVSHVINQTRFVSEPIRERVLRAIAELEYYPSAVARGLAVNKTKIVGVVVSDITNPFFTGIYAGIEDCLADKGYGLFLANTAEQPAQQERVLTTLLLRRVDGIILAPSGHRSEILRTLVRNGIAVVLLDRKEPELELPLVSVDNEAGAFTLVRHLVSDGHTRIALITGLARISTTQDRRNGYIRALKESGLAVEEQMMIAGESSQHGGKVGMTTLLSRRPRPSAVFVTNNQMMLGVLHAIRESGLTCPNDMALAGFDDHEWADVFTPPITVLRQPTHDLGLRAGELLQQLMEEPERAPMESVTLDVELVVRGSCSVRCLEQSRHS